MASHRVANGWHCLALLIAASLSACGGGGGSHSAPASAVAPVISTQPSNQTVTAGQPVQFVVAATGQSPLKYQWQRNGSAISGASSAAYSIPATVIGDDGSRFEVTVSNMGGSVNSASALLTVNAASSAPSILTQPASQTVSVGQNADFSVVASGTAPLIYQWQKDGAAISGATGSEYATPGTTAADNGSSFTVVVRNAVGSVTSNAAALTVTAASAAGTDILTYKYNAMRTGLNPSESVLTPANVAVRTFGKLRSLAVDGLVDAQPLYLSNLQMTGGAHNVVFVATEHDSVYAFDVDSGKILWHVSLAAAGESPSDDHGCGQIKPEIGITSTPVIDRSAGTHGIIYVVAMTKDASSAYHQRLHALDVATGAETTAAPTEIAATYDSTTFMPGQYAERAALLLANGVIYTAWTSHCDLGDYGGWIIAFNQATLGKKGALNVARGASGSGPASQGPAIWMSGGGPAADAAGNVFVLTANGRFETSLIGGFPSEGDYGNSFLKISSSTGALAVADYFTMSGEVTESTKDLDLGSGGIMLLPDMTDSTGAVRQLAVGAGKDGNIYVVNRGDMGKFTSVGNNIWQELDSVLPGGVFGTPAYFDSTLFYGPKAGPLKAFAMTNARVSNSPVSQTATSFAYPGTLPSVSANGTENALVWAYENSSPAVLHVYAASDLEKELYNSNQAANQRDQFGSGNKFIVPVVADGKVFVATTNSVAVFGPLP